MNLSEKFKTYVVFDPDHMKKYTDKKTIKNTDKAADLQTITDRLREAVRKSFPYEPAIYNVTGDFPAVCIKTTPQEAEKLKKNLSGLCLQKR